MYSRSWLLGGSIVITGLSACTSGGSGETSASDGPCETAGRKICERGCACGAECKTGFQTNFGGATTFTWSDQADCEGNYVTSRCRNGGDPAVDYAACLDAVNAATCTDESLVVPTACEPPRDGGS